VRYKEIENEIRKVIAVHPPDKVKPFLWYIPPYIDEGIRVEHAFQNLPYGGIKLHPRAHRWDLQDGKHLDCLHTLFGYAEDAGLPVLIHTGEDDFEKPAFFEQFIAEYQGVHCILAHCRPVLETIAMFRAYKNVYGDTAFLPEANLQKIIQADFADRILPGSDFPVTHFMANKFKQGGAKDVSLAEQYAADFEQLQRYRGIIQEKENEKGYSDILTFRKF
jgi:predicted TIM-barrel fold metal-dependent hydrolase